MQDNLRDLAADRLVAVTGVRMAAPGGAIEKYARGWLAALDEIDRLLEIMVGNDTGGWFALIGWYPDLAARVKYYPTKAEAIAAVREAALKGAQGA